MKQTVCVLFGGQSTEYSISLRSVTSVLENLDKERYAIITVGITQDGNWRLYDGPYEKIQPDNWYSDALKEVAITKSGLLIFEDDHTYSRKHIDVIFPVLHGKNGEDGTVQGLFELAGIPYVGVGVLASCIGMDKAFAKIVFASAGIDQADWVVIQDYDMARFDAIAAQAEEKLGYPMFVKPANTGSSIGIGKAKDRAQLKAAVQEAFRYDRKVIVEEFLTGHEVECAVLGGYETIEASCVGEILASQEFYTFDAKYSDDCPSTLIIPAELPAGITEAIRENAIKAFRALDGHGLARVDFFTDGKTVRINEINTMPGFTSISMYAKLFAQVGVPYRDLLTRLIELAARK